MVVCDIYIWVEHTIRTKLPVSSYDNIRNIRFIRSFELTSKEIHWYDKTIWENKLNHKSNCIGVYTSYNFKKTNTVFVTELFEFNDYPIIVIFQFDYRAHLYRVLLYQPFAFNYQPRNSRREIAHLACPMRSLYKDFTIFHFWFFNKRNFKLHQRL